MFTNFFWFEVKLRLKSVSTYVYFALWFVMVLFSVSSEDFGPVGTGKVALNGPWALSTYYVQLTAFGTVVLSAIFGTSILRDFKEDTYQLLFTKPISKAAYLGGRWAGSMAICFLVFLGMPLGALIGGAMPWADHSRIHAVRLGFFLQPWLSITAVQIFFLGSLFFMVAALTRKLVIVYLQGVAIFALYLIGATIVISSRSLHTFWPSVLDPLGLVLFDSVTRYWTVAEKNSQVVSWSGIFLYNRLLWLGAGVAANIATLVFFPLSAEALTARRSARRAAARKDEDAISERPKHISLPRVAGIFGPSTVSAQIASLTRLRFNNIVREIPFWAIALIMAVLCVVNARQAGHFRDVSVWPVTFLMAEALQNGVLFLIVIATLYAGEVVWRERDVRFDGIQDALPVPGWSNFLSQFFALALVQLVLITLIVVCGIGVQVSLGYYNFELPVYFKELYLILFPNMLGFVLFALFLQTIVSNKFVGHGLVIGLNVGMIIFSRYGYENRLYQLLQVAPYTYSDMNGYGHFVRAIVWSTVYWSAFAAILGVLSIAFARRGADLAWRSRWSAFRQRWPRLQPVFLVFLLAMLGSGGWYYYNAHVLNEYRSAKDTRRLQAAYEKSYKKYETLPLPKITSVEVAVDIFPERRSFQARGHYLLVNHTGRPLNDIHVSGIRESLDDVRFDLPFHIKSADKRLGYWIYTLEKPLAPGDTVRLDFKASHESRGFRDGGELNEFAYDGTFFDRDYFPIIGYSRTVELDDPVRRKEEGLPEFVELAPRGDPFYSNVNLFTADSEWITFKCVVSTSPDQIAMAPGYLKREWTNGERRYFEYDMGDTKINDFYSFLSGRFDVKREVFNGVKLEILYHPGHEYNLERMLQASRKGLDYFGKNFAPYQFRQFRIIEYPRYRTFAQSFPNTVPFSEGIGFIQRMQKPEDLDQIFYVTAHELAHQWWGHQLIGSMTKGSNMMSESLAQYSALMIMEKEYGKDKMQLFLKHELDRYLRGRSAEKRREPPLTLVQNEPYVWYNKGSLAMYALRDYMGEDAVNAGLRKFLLANRYATGPFPDTRGFLAAMQDAAPPDVKPLVAELLDSIVLYDNKATTATWTQLPDGKYKVKLALQTRKLKSDGLGAETETPLNDWIDVGVFSGDPNHEKVLYLEKRKFTGKDTSLEVIVDEKPARAGIDPYHKLIDRKPDDNTVNVSRS